ncbi:MAG: hypothetical protein RL701_3424 [Pseudomonadota bacterium]
MMTGATKDPERLLHPNSQTGELARDLLQRVRPLHVPDHAQAHVWDAVTASIALGAATTTLAATSGAAAASAGGLGSKLVGVAIAHAGIITKLGAVLVIGSASAGTTYWLQQRDEHSARAERTQVSNAQAAEAPTRARVPEPSPQVIELTPNVERGVQPTAAKSVRPKDRKPSNANVVDGDLALENELVQSAREHLRAGEKRAAHAKLRELRERVPHGVLMQERTVLWIELERLRGKRDSARRAAQAFVREHPESPHTAKLRRFLAEP